MKFSYHEAVQLITYGVQAGKITLLGASGDVETSKRRAAMDAAYLTELLTQITEKLDAQDGL